MDICGYKLYLTCTTERGELSTSITADVTTANVQTISVPSFNIFFDILFTISIVHDS